MLLLVNLGMSTMTSVIVEERNELGLKCHPAMLSNLGVFCKNFHKESIHSLTLFHRSLIVTHVYLLTRACLYSALLIWLVFVEFGLGVKRHLLDSNLLQDQRSDP